MRRTKEDKNYIDPEKVIQIHAVTDGPETKGWVHTHGMEVFNLPNLEIKGVPIFLSYDAMALLNGVADYMLNGDKPIKAGEVMQLGRRLIKFAKATPIEGDEGHYEYDVLELIDPDVPQCCRCEKGNCPH